MGVDIPLRNRVGEIRAHTRIDAADEHLTRFRWCLMGGYAMRRVGGKSIYLHRVLLGLVPGDGLEVDHVNRDRLDNRRDNLRIATRGQNNQNRASRPNTTSTHRGVYRYARTGRWAATGWLDGSSQHLGYFSSEEEASVVASEFRTTHMPFAVESV